MTCDDDGLESAITILSQRQERLIAVTQGIGELDDLWHAAEMLAEADAVAEAQVGLIEEAVIEVEIVGQRQVRNVPAAQQLDIITVDADVVGCDLLIVADDDDFLGDIVEEER